MIPFSKSLIIANEDITDKKINSRKTQQFVCDNTVYKSGS